MEEMTPRHMATELVWIIHRSIDWDAWRSKALTYWNILQGAVAASAYTADLPKWLNSVSSRMGIHSLGRTPEDRQTVEEIMNSAQDRQILKALRDETAYCIVMVRARNEALKQENAD